MWLYIQKIRLSYKIYEIDTILGIIFPKVTTRCRKLNIMKLNDLICNCIMRSSLVPAIWGGLFLFRNCVKSSMASSESWFLAEKAEPA